MNARDWQAIGGPCWVLLRARPGFTRGVCRAGLASGRCLPPAFGCLHLSPNPSLPRSRRSHLLGAPPHATGGPAHGTAGRRAGSETRCGVGSSQARAFSAVRKGVHHLPVRPHVRLSSGAGCHLPQPLSVGRTSQAPAMAVPLRFRSGAHTSSRWWHLRDSRRRGAVRRQDRVMGRRAPRLTTPTSIIAITIAAAGAQGVGAQAGKRVGDKL
jgi:hypothetical protein